MNDKTEGPLGVSFFKNCAIGDLKDRLREISGIAQLVSIIMLTVAFALHMGHETIQAECACEQRQEGD